MKKDIQKVPLKQAKVGGTNFLVTIYSQDNMNLQGVIKWLDSDLTLHFRNTFEFLELIDEALHLQNNVENSRRSWITGCSDRVI